MMKRMHLVRKTHLALIALALAFVPLAHGDESRTGDGRVIENPTQDGDLNFRLNIGGTKVNVLGFTGATGRPTFKSGTGSNQNVVVNSGTAAGSAGGTSELEFRQANSSRAYLGVSGLANGLIAGDAVSDFSIVSVANPINFSTDNGTTRHMQISTAGRLTAGPSGRQTAISVGQGQAAALFGNPSSQNFSLANSGSTTIAISAASNGTALCMIENGNSGNSALLFMGGAGNSMTIVSQTGSAFVTGAPASNQTQVTFTSSGSTLNVTDGSANGTSHFVVCMGTFI